MSATPSAQYRLTIRVRMDGGKGLLGAVTTAIAAAGGMVIAVDIVDDAGKSVPLGGGGYIVLTRPWPSMLRGIYGDDERYTQTYWSKFPHKYLAGDGCKRDLEGGDRG